MAEKAGVSITTVSRVLNSPEMVNTQTKEKVLETIKELNYTPNWFARNLQNNRTHMIAVVLPDNLQQSDMELTKGIEKIAVQKKCSVTLVNTSYDREAELEQVRNLVEKNIDGLVLISSTLEKEDLEMLKDKDTPFVMVGKTASSEGENIVFTNYDTAVYDAVAYLIEMGRKKIAFILPPEKSFNDLEKLSGYRKALSDRDFTENPNHIVEADDSLEGGFAATSKLINSSDRPDAIFACTDMMAFGAIEAMKQNELGSDDIGIIGFDGLEVGAIVEPKLTTVSRPSYRMGLTAGRILFDLIENETPADEKGQEIMLQSKLKIRKSCGNKERLREIW